MEGVVVVLCPAIPIPRPDPRPILWPLAVVMAFDFCGSGTQHGSRSIICYGIPSVCLLIRMSIKLLIIRRMQKIIGARRFFGGLPARFRIHFNIKYISTKTRKAIMTKSQKSDDGFSLSCSKWHPIKSKGINKRTGDKPEKIILYLELGKNIMQEKNK